MTDDTSTMTAGAALLSRMATLGVDYIFANSGTDFPPVIEGLSEAEAAGIALPETVTVPFESAAVAMAHGYTLATGRPQAVMVHTNVGLANAAMGAINAACDNIPMLLMSGRTPTVEKGRLGARTVPIGWGQEMLDQSSLIREACKWDYELRFPEQIFDVMDRAHGIATSTPKGPVYVSLPREVLSETIPAKGAARRPQMAGVQVQVVDTQMAQVAEVLANATHPVIFAQHGAGSAAAFDALSRLAARWGIPVCQYWAVELALPTTHPMAAGPDPRALLERADVVLCLDVLAPWSPNQVEPLDDALVIQIGPRPLQERSGVRNFRCDLGVTSEVAPAILALEAALDLLWDAQADRVTQRAKTCAKAHGQEQRKRFDAALATRDGAALTKSWISHALARSIAGVDAAVFSELGCQLPFMQLARHQSWFDGPHAGGLGWGFPAAMGFALAQPDKTVIATMGDGSYMFANPVACHQIAEALGLSLIVIVLNNAEWGAVRSSVVDIYPDGHAARANAVPLTDLSPSPDFVKVAEASRAWARHVSDADGFEAALAEAQAHVTAKRGLALIEVAIGKS
ncbi:MULTISPECIES: thiamine pyrophosphate-requiring protein [Roseobacteraceae]|uniref:Acetolactate synthase isozyme 3 large subunit n=1 Tax=Pseudosulfitobacter pseudonitzschiae TaxID=1402135 RepID=A0A221K7N8_9RHOB|nr:MULTISPECIES: thiamine pyrophosphate-requiring protein [Roseobacteraceae]ASM74867.1 acetolactate synthase isozyme 3 large subunit [Pseudosulfitobacter pseudonitzschiae]